MKSLETILTELLDNIAPAQLRLRVLRPDPELIDLSPVLFRGGRPASYELSFKTRSFDEGFVGISVREVASDALDSMKDGPNDRDPGVCTWYELDRMQREVVEQLLEQMEAKYRARAAKKNLLHDRDAAADYLIADAFNAALEALAFELENVAGAQWEPLSARANGPETPTDGEDAKAKKARRKKLASTVADLRQQNRKQAKKGSFPRGEPDQK